MLAGGWESPDGTCLTHSRDQQNNPQGKQLSAQWPVCLSPSPHDAPDSPGFEKRNKYIWRIIVSLIKELSLISPKLSCYAVQTNFTFTQVASFCWYHHLSTMQLFNLEGAAYYRNGVSTCFKSVWKDIFFSLKEGWSGWPQILKNPGCQSIYRLQMYLQTYFIFLPLKHFYNTNKKKRNITS